jgi:hypothetical protein
MTNERLRSCVTGHWAVDVLSMRSASVPQRRALFVLQPFEGDPPIDVSTRRKQTKVLVPNSRCHCNFRRNEAMVACQRHAPRTPPSAAPATNYDRLRRVECRRSKQAGS